MSRVLRAMKFMIMWGLLAFLFLSIWSTVAQEIEFLKVGLWVYFPVNLSVSFAAALVVYKLEYGG